MEPLVWLALPFVVTAVAAVVLYRRHARALRPQDEAERQAQLRRMAAALQRQGAGGEAPSGPE